MSGTAEVKAAEARLAQHRDDAVHAKVQLGESLEALKAAQSRLLVKRLDETIEEQRNVEREALAYSKNVNSLYQRAAKWKAEQRRFRAHLEVRYPSRSSSLVLRYSPMRRVNVLRLQRCYCDCKC
jgi:hypothetical protein